MGQRRAPGVEDAGKADPGTEMLGVCGDGDQGLGGALEQDAIDRGLVLVGDVADLSGQGEDHVIVWHQQQLGPARGEPVLGRGALALGTMPVAAGVVGDVAMTAVLAGCDMAAEGRGAAALDGRHDLELAEAHVAGVGYTPGRAVGAEDIRDLQRWTRHDAAGFTRLSFSSPSSAAAPAGS